MDLTLDTGNVEAVRVDRHALELGVEPVFEGYAQKGEPVSPQRMQQ